MALVWGTIRVTNHQSVVYYNVDFGFSPHFEFTLNSGDSTWAFGQVIAVILLLLPFISFSEAVCGQSHSLSRYGSFSLELRIQSAQPHA